MTSATVHNPSQAVKETEAQILRILRSSDRPLRQHEIAYSLGLPEHNNWSTHAILKSLVSSGSVAMISTIVPTGKGAKHPTRVIKTYTDTPPRTFNNRQAINTLSLSGWVANQIKRMTTR